MQTQGVVLIFLLLLAEVLGYQHRHAFFRDIVMIENGLPTRRLFGGEPVPLSHFPAVCAVFNKYWNLKCTGSIITSHWVLTAGHCIASDVTWIKYNTRYPKTDTGSIASVMYLYMHPEFHVKQEDRGDGMDVVELRNDVGLVRTNEELLLNTPLVINIIQAMRMYEPSKLNFEDVEVLGFGRTTKYEPAWAIGNQLFGAKLKLVKCDRETWSFCICAKSGVDNPRGVCSGDSGGPMVYNGSQIGITSMGPQECSTNNISAATITSVFTTLHQYADIITRTIDNKKGSKQMTLIYGSHNRLIPHCTMVLLCLLFA